MTGLTSQGALAQKLVGWIFRRNAAFKKQQKLPQRGKCYTAKTEMMCIGTKLLKLAQPSGSDNLLDGSSRFSISGFALAYTLRIYGSRTPESIKGFPAQRLPLLSW
jgi:hypothetical protein